MDDEWQMLVNKVNAWARINDEISYCYGSRYSYWRSALISEVITKEEFNIAEIKYGDLWHYRGD